MTPPGHPKGGGQRAKGAKAPKEEPPPTLQPQRPPPPPLAAPTSTEVVEKDLTPRVRQAVLPRTIRSENI